MVAGIIPQSEGLKRAASLGIATTAEGIAPVLEQGEIQAVFDSSGAKPHLLHAPLLKEAGKIDTGGLHVRGQLGQLHVAIHYHKEYGEADPAPDHRQSAQPVLGSIRTLGDGFDANRGAGDGAVYTGAETVRPRSRYDWIERIG